MKPERRHSDSGSRADGEDVEPGSESGEREAEKKVRAQSTHAGGPPLSGREGAGSARLSRERLGTGERRDARNAPPGHQIPDAENGERHER